MSRALTAAVAAEFVKKRLAPVILVEAQFVSGWVRLWTGMGSVTWGGNTYQGVATPNGEVLGMISQLQETATMQAQSVTLTLLGVPSSAAQQALTECRPGFAANVYVGALDIDSGAIIADPYRGWSGTVDVPSVSEDGPTSSISITVESRLMELQRPRHYRYTDQDQQLFSPGDLGFQFVGALQQMSVTWGKGGNVAPRANVPVPLPK